MNIRKPTDYSAMYAVLDQLMETALPQVELYFEMGRVICARSEKGAAVAASEYLQAAYPKASGFSPRNLRRMREFYRAYEITPELVRFAMKLGWTQNVVILEAELTMEERAWYLRAAKQFSWSKKELADQISASAHLKSSLDGAVGMCYTEQEETVQECEKQDDKDTFCVSRQDRSLTAGTPDMSAFFGNDLCDLRHTYTKKLPLRSPDKKPKVGPVLPA